MERPPGVQHFERFFQHQVFAVPGGVRLSGVDSHGLRFFTKITPISDPVKANTAAHCMMRW